MTAARIVSLLALADEAPEAEELLEYLHDPDATVRRTALTVLSETTEEWERASTLVATALRDPDPQVRRTAVELLAELREVLVADPEFESALREVGAHPDPAVRAASIGNLWRHHRAGLADAEHHLSDPDPRVRIEAVLALVSRRAADALVGPATDPAAEVRAEVARGLGSIGDPRGAATLTTLAADADSAVVAAAFTALAHTGCPPSAAALATAALAAPEWRIREAAAIALAGAEVELAAGPLITASTEPNLDVRKAAVRAMARFAPEHAEVAAALARATRDVDADVRGYARQALNQLRSPSER